MVVIVVLYTHLEVLGLRCTGTNATRHDATQIRSRFGTYLVYFGVCLLCRIRVRHDRSKKRLKISKGCSCAFEMYTKQRFTHDVYPFERLNLNGAQIFIVGVNRCGKEYSFLTERVPVLTEVQ
ncbi:uncharacterized protein M6B38_114365 [Iris pallida]|uniref:Uncharacterized protein n=1 Tax=Iris pallida TaxID=29817 RepID=A0AAX6F2J7_IRIPA|nr:uncharacterized protein M6B38_159110 [Iris pallida]KAJ6853802.1 uncharacterized protein M6B38_114365 [Iris pallida]